MLRTRRYGPRRRRRREREAACEQAGLDKLPGAWTGQVDCATGGGYVTADVHLDVPVLFPGSIAFPSRSTDTRAPWRRTSTEMSYSRKSTRDRGQVALEYLGFIPILILVAMAGVQIGLIAYTAQQAGTAARAGARAASLDMSAQEGCVNAISDWLSVDCAEGGGGDSVTVTATVQIPSIVPGWDFDPAVKTATMPLDH